MASASSSSVGSSGRPFGDLLSNIPLTPTQLAGVGAGLGAALLAYGLDKQYLISHDLGYIRKMISVMQNMKAHIKNNITTADLWEDTVNKNAKKTSIVFEGREWTYEQLDRYANRVANWLLARGFKAGDVLALLMENRAEYMPIWMGVLKVGGIAALINYNVRGKPLMHSLTISGAKLLIAGVEQIDCVREIAPQLAEAKWSVYALGQSFDIAPSLEPELERVPDTRPSPKVRAKATFNDSALLVYTSGTTGLPKAATIRHSRLYSMGYGFIRMFEIRPDDRIYTVLPLYHSAGGLVGVGMMMFSGATLLLKRKFSASQFWTDTKEQKATVIQYIGELCRYLLGSPPGPNDRQNTVRIAIGNGLRPDIWEQFQTRFNIPEVGEFYGSTEGNAALLNHCKDARARGCVGHMGPLLQKISKLRLVRFDVLREEPIRDKNGFCIECQPGEVGELLGQITDDDPLRAFAGYHGNKEATNKKIARDVLKKGDQYFRSGDLLRVDTSGYWYFIDRIGDTFRWKGENVSTTEVAEAVSTYPGVEEVNVYGVEVPHQDGRACCAAMVLGDNIDFAGLYSVCNKNLPSYAVPLFIRKLPKIDITGTFKHQKVELRNQGINPSKCVSDGKQDQLFVVDPKNKTYRPFIQADYDRLVAEKSNEFGGAVPAAEQSKKKRPVTAPVVAQSKL